MHTVPSITALARGLGCHVAIVWDGNVAPQLRDLVEQLVLGEVHNWREGGEVGGVNELKSNPDKVHICRTMNTWWILLPDVHAPIAEHDKPDSLDVLTNTPCEPFPNVSRNSDISMSFCVHSASVYLLPISTGTAGAEDASFAAR